MLNSRNSWWFFITNFSRYHLYSAYIPSASFGVTQSSWTKLSTKLLKRSVPFSGIMHTISRFKLLAFWTTAYLKGTFPQTYLSMIQETSNNQLYTHQFHVWQFHVFIFLVNILLAPKPMSTSSFLKWFLALLKLTSQRMLVLLHFSNISGLIYLVIRSLNSWWRSLYINDIMGLAYCYSVRNDFMVSAI